MRRAFFMVLGVAALAAVTSLAVLGGGTRTSTAAFTTTSRSTLQASALHVHDWVNLYSRATDPQSDTGYADQVGNTLPATSGQDDGIVVDFVIAGAGTYTHNRVLKVRTAPGFPDLTPDPAVTAVTVSVSVTPDPATGQQPISKFGVDVWGAAPTYTKTIAGWGAGVRRQLSLQTKFPGKKFGPGLYEPSVVLTVTYTGLTAAFFQYTIPVRIQYR